MREQGTFSWVIVLALLLGTFTGTLANNIVNVPIRTIAHGLHASVPSSTLVVTSFSLAFAILMPLTGWLGDRVGRRRVLCWALVTIAVGALAAMGAPTLPVLVVCRVVQGAGTAAVLPTVMGLLADLCPPDRRGQALGMWAAMNGLGRAVSAPVGGLLSTGISWRWIFAPVVPLALLSLVGVLLWVPRSTGMPSRLDWRGATLLTGGCALLISAVTAIPDAGVVSPLVIALCVSGMVLLVGFVRSSRSQEKPFIDPALLREPSYLRSTLAAFAQMFCLYVALLAVPLYLTRGHRMSTIAAGMAVFALPAVMIILGPIAGGVVYRIGPRRVLRTGMVVLILGDLCMMVVLHAVHNSVSLIVVGLVIVGAGAALVQTPAAVGATRSAAGQQGTGLGLYNLVRFAGSAIGAAWVAIALGLGYSAVFAASAVIGLAGLAATWLGTYGQSNSRRHGDQGSIMGPGSLPPGSSTIRPGEVEQPTNG